MFLSENSLYNTPAEYAALIGDKRKVADLLYLNFLGILGLIKINDKAGAIVSYIAQEKKLRPTTINEQNNDLSLVVKMALDAGVIIQPAAVAATKFLVLVKTKKVRGADIKDDPLRDIIKSFRIQSNRPSQKIYSVVQDFVDGKLNLEGLTAKLHKLSKLPDYTEISKEFRDLITRGGFIGDLLKLSAPTAKSPATSTTLAPVAVAAKTKSADLPPDGAQSGSDADYMKMLAHMFKMRSMGQGYLKRFGLFAGFDSKRFIEFVQRPDFVLQTNPHYTWSEHPFAKWIKKRDLNAYNVFVTAMAGKTTNISPTVSAAIQTKAARSAPRPAAVIPISTTPVITADSINEMLKQDTVVSLNAIMKKYAFTPDVIKNPTNKQTIINLMVNDSYLDTYVKNVGIFGAGVIRDLPFLRWCSRHSGDRVFLNIMPYRILVSTLMQVAKAKKIELLLKLLDKWLDVLKTRFKWNWAGDVKLPTMLEEAGLKNESVFLQYFIDNSELFTHDVMQYLNLPHLGFSSISIRLIHFIRSQGNKSFTDSLFHEIKTVIGAENVQFDRSTTMVTFNINENAFATLDQRTTRLFKAFSGKYYNLNLEKYDESKLETLKVFDILQSQSSYAVPTVENKNIVLAWAAKTDPTTVTFPFTATAAWSKLDMFTVPTNWTFKYLHANLKSLAISYWGVPDSYSGFLEYMLDNNLFDNLERGVIRDLLGAMMRRGTNKEDAAVLKRLMKVRNPDLQTYILNEAQLHKVLAALDYKYDPVLLKFTRNPPGFVINSFEAHTEEAAKYFNAYRKERTMAQSPDPAVVPSSIHLDTWLRSAWFFLPTDPEWDEASKNVETKQYIPSGEGGNLLSFFKHYNPRMFDILEAKIKKNASSDLNTALVYAKTATPDEAAAAFVSCFKRMNGVTARDWETNRSYLTTVTRIAANSAQFNVTTKKALLSAYVRNMDTMKVGKVRKDIIDSINSSFIDILLEIHETDVKFANEIFADIRTTTRNMLIKRLGQERYMNLIKDELYKYPIKPEMQLTPDRIKTILKYNNLQMNIPKGKKDIKTIEDIATSVEKGVSSVGKLKIEETNMDDKEHDLMTLEIHKLRNDKHGDFCMKVIKTFNVNFPGSKERLDAFKKAHPTSKVMPRVFHGTGSVAASMILRNGFVVISSNDQSATGRMLGNGIYFSDVSNKAAQYVSDQGFGRRYGTRGYLFEMEAVLGEPRTHYRSAGYPGSTDGGARSPEWAVFRPKDQLRIYRVHYIELVPERTITEIAEKHKVNLNEARMTFEHYLKERTNQPDQTVSTFLFMDGMLPQNRDTVLEMSKYKAPKNVIVTDSADGVILEVYHSHDIDPVIAKIPGTMAWLGSETEQVDFFFNLIQ